MAGIRSFHLLMRFPAYLLFVLLILHVIPVRSGDLPVITRYDIDVHFLLKQQRISVTATLSIRNTSDAPHTSIPFLLYRLLSVEQITDGSGRPMAFTQQVTAFSDHPPLQARQVSLQLPSPLRPQDSLTITISYEGYIFGYPEVMRYTQERIDESYALLRPDVFAYPLLAEASFAGFVAAFGSRFTYDISATVPDGYAVASGGELLDRRARADSTTYAFRSKRPVDRIDLAVSRFSVFEDQENRLTVYCLPEDSAGAAWVLDASKRAIGLYGSMFGTPKDYQGYTIIEIPEGWGSQAGDLYILQAGGAFKDSTKLGELYHEIAHSWNARSSGEVQRCRYFDEAFASFFEALAIRAFRGEGAFEERLERARRSFVRSTERDREAYDTPITGYGAKEIGSNSYTKGSWSLHVLYRIVGEEAFTSIVRSLLAEYGDRPVDFEKFRALCERVSGRSLERFFEEWIEGTESSRLLVENVPIGEIVQRY